VKRDIVDTATHAPTGNGPFLPFCCSIPVYEEMATGAAKNILGKISLTQSAALCLTDIYIVSNLILPLLCMKAVHV
jgi:hypothetical protein